MHIPAAIDAAPPQIEDPDDLISWVEPDSGLIRVLGRGFWTQAHVELHVTALRGLIARQRAAGGRVLVLVDLRETLAQDPAIIERLGQAVDGVYREGDRVAVAVASSLLKLQLKLVANVASVEFFVSLRAARTWLTAYL